MEDINETIDQLGVWQNLNVEGIPLLTVKTYGDNLYAQLNTYVAPLGPNTDFYYQGGCCVDTFKRFNKNGEDADDNIDSYDIMETVFEIFENITDTDKNTGTPFAYANHVFDMFELDGDVISMMAITYHEPGLNYSEVEAVMYFNTTSNSPMKTKDGLSFFSFYENIGTLSTTASDSIYKIMVKTTVSCFPFLFCFSFSLSSNSSSLKKKTFFIYFY